MDTLFLKRMALASSVLLCAFCSSAREIQNQTFQLENVYQPSANNNKLCLLPEGDDGDVALDECSKQANLNGLFILVKSSGEYYTIRPATNSELCLRTFAGSQNVKLDNCAENNSMPANYSSMRDWALTKIGGLYNLQNRYKSDTGSLFSCLSVLNSSDSIGVGECAISGVNTDYNNMRLWQLVY